MIYVAGEQARSKIISFVDAFLFASPVFWASPAFWFRESPGCGEAARKLPRSWSRAGCGGTLAMVFFFFSPLFSRTHLRIPRNFVFVSLFVALEFQVLMLMFWERVKMHIMSFSLCASRACEEVRAPVLGGGSRTRFLGFLFFQGFLYEHFKLAFLIDW